MDRDRARQIWVTVCQALSLVGTAIGVGAFGGTTAVADNQNGIFTAEGSLLTPSGSAFGIWTPIYLGLLLHTVVQWLPSRRTDPRYRATGALAGAAMLLNALWLVVVQWASAWLSVVVILALVLCLGLLARRLVDSRRGDTGWGVLDRLAMPITFGLYLGWVMIATCANITTVLKGEGVDLAPSSARWVAVAVLVVALALCILVQLRLGGLVWAAVASAWGLAWIGWAQHDGDRIVSAVALLSAAVLIATTLAVLRTRRSTR